MGTRTPIALSVGVVKDLRSTFLPRHVSLVICTLALFGFAAVVIPDVGGGEPGPGTGTGAGGIRQSYLHTIVLFPFAFVFIISGVPKCFVLCVHGRALFHFPQISLVFFYILGFPCIFGVLFGPARVYNFSCFTVVVRFFFCARSFAGCWLFI